MFRLGVQMVVRLLASTSWVNDSAVRVCDVLGLGLVLQKRRESVYHWSAYDYEVFVMYFL